MPPRTASAESCQPEFGLFRVFLGRSGLFHERCPTQSHAVRDLDATLRSKVVLGHTDTAPASLEAIGGPPGRPEAMMDQCGHEGS
jgi:hypothetical protein